MMQQAHLIETIYQTVQEPESWPKLLGEMVTATGSRSARLLVMNVAANRVLASTKVNIDDDCHRQYADYFVNQCPWRPELKHKPSGRLYSTYLHFSCRQPDFYRTEFFNDWARQQDIHHGLCGTVYGDDERSVQLLLQRTSGQGHYTEQDTRFVNTLVPHLQHALLAAGQIAQVRVEADAIARAAESEARPFLLLDRQLRIRYCSPLAEKLLVEGEVLTSHNGRPVLTDHSCDRRLKKLLRQCLDGAISHTFAGGGSITVQRPGRLNLYLLLRPVHPAMPLLAGETDVFVAIYCHDPQAAVRLDQERLRELYGLSAAEARVVVALVATPDSENLARQCCISLNTLRSHLKSVYLKTESNSRAELMKRLLTSPARDSRTESES
ncbi:MAG: LuxR family transcriptional regulator [Thermodesulfobacteriota bacterium]|jgi:DNA-binding CsgD family transcriptional regulator|nr:LuxR family transcriptional regulator [Thermodesulfobacteriota bacterium]